MVIQLVESGSQAYGTHSLVCLMSCEMKVALENPNFDDAMLA